MVCALLNIYRHHNIGLRILDPLSNGRGPGQSIRFVCYPEDRRWCAQESSALVAEHQAVPPFAERNS